jgi:hypothetical protein
MILSVYNCVPLCLSFLTLITKWAVRKEALAIKYSEGLEPSGKEQGLYTGDFCCSLTTATLKEELSCGWLAGKYSPFSLTLLTEGGSGVKFRLGTDLGSVSTSPIRLTIGGENAKLTQDQHLGATSPYTISLPRGHMEGVWADWFLSFQVSIGGKKIPCLRKRTRLTPYPRARYSPKIHPRPLLSQLFLLSLFTGCTRTETEAETFEINFISFAKVPNH